MARQSLWIGRRGKPRCDHCRLKNLKVRILHLVQKSALIFCWSVIVFYPHVTIAPGQMAGNVNTHRCRLPHIEEFRAVTNVVHRI